MYDAGQYLSSELGRVLESTEIVLANAETDLKEVQEEKKVLEESLALERLKHKEEVDLLTGQLDEARGENTSLKSMLLDHGSKGVHEERWGKASITTVLRMLERGGSDAGRRAMTILLEIRKETEREQEATDRKMDEMERELRTLRSSVAKLQKEADEKAETEVRNELIQKLLKELEEWKTEAKTAQSRLTNIQSTERDLVKQGEELVLERVLRELEDTKRDRDEISYELGLAVAELESAGGADSSALRRDVSQLREAMACKEVELSAVTSERDSLIQEVATFKEDTIQQLRQATASLGLRAAVM